MGGINGAETKEAPIYFGGNERLLFIDNQYNRARDDFDDFLIYARLS